MGRIKLYSNTAFIAHHFTVTTIIHIGRSAEFHNQSGFSLLGLQQATRSLKFMLLYLHHLKYRISQRDFQKCMVELQGRGFSMPITTEKGQVQIM
jgi:hypothetical protein